MYELYLQAGTPTLDAITAWIAADDQLAGAPGRDTIGRVIGDATMPASQADVMAVASVLARGARWDPQDAAGRARDLWVAARMASARSPMAGIRVSQVDPRRLGVHAAISVPGVSDEVLPEYVPRDADTAEFGVRSRVATAVERGGFVLLTGESSVGKTRCAVEAIKALLADWRLVHPAGPGEVAALAAEPLARTVVWLDELQRYLDGEQGLAGGTVRALLNAPGPVVIIATLWPDRYAAYTTVPTPGGPDPHARAREALNLASVVRISPVFSPAEQNRACDAATRDRRLRIALNAEGYGLTQTLAAAPQLVAQWENADPYARAVLSAALDPARLGARAPLTTEFLRAASPGYCSSRQKAEAPGNWFEQALAYATTKLHGAVAALAPAGSSMGQVDGYTVADYLLQHVVRERRAAHVPASTWDAFLAHVRDPDDAARLAGSAERRLLYCYAIPLNRHAADVGDRHAARQLASLLAGRGDLQEAQEILRVAADAGDRSAAEKLAELLGDCGDLDQLRVRADFGDEPAVSRLAWLLADRGDLEELRIRAGLGDEAATERLADLLARRGDLGELRARAGTGDGHAAKELAGLLARSGELDELRARADAGDEPAAMRLADLLAGRGDLDQAQQILRVRADAGDKLAAKELAGLLARSGELDELRVRADAGNWDATYWLAWLLARRGDLEELRIRANDGDEPAAKELARLLADRGALDELRARADSHDWDAAEYLAQLLADRGDLDELRARADAEDEPAARQLANLPVRRGDLDELRARADTYDWNAAEYLARLLADQRDLDELRTRADAGDESAAYWLAELLADSRDIDELRTRADASDGHAAKQLALLLADRGNLDEAEQITRDRSIAGNGNSWWLAELLTRQGRHDEAERLRRFGLNPDGSTSSGHLIS